MKKSICVLTFALIGELSLGQGKPDSVQLQWLNELKSASRESLFVHWNRNTGTPEIIQFSGKKSFGSNPKLSAEMTVATFKGVMGLGDGNSLELVSERTSDVWRTFRFDHKYDGIRVRKSEYVVTTDFDGNVLMVMGGVHKDISINTVPAISAKDVFDRINTNNHYELIASEVVVFPGNNQTRLVWEIETKTITGLSTTFIIDANNGEVIDTLVHGCFWDPVDLARLLSFGSSIEEETTPETFGFADGLGNVYLTNPVIDGNNNWPTVTLPRLHAGQPYIHGQFARTFVGNAGDVAISWGHDFRYPAGTAHFTQANLYYHIDKFRFNYWELLFQESVGFGEIKAMAHDIAIPNNAAYIRDEHMMRFGVGDGTHNDFGREDKVIYHEYTHAVTIDVVGLDGGVEHTESAAINEGNSDYFASTYTNRILIGEWVGHPLSGGGHASPISVRNITQPRCSTYAAYNQPSTYIQYGHDYGLWEPHIGGELWSSSLWSLRQDARIGVITTDRLVYRSLPVLPTTATFLQYRQAILNYDWIWYDRVHANVIANILYARGIGPDSVKPQITGPSSVYHPASKGSINTYTWNSSSTTGGTPPYSYKWYRNGDQVGTSSTYSENFSWNGSGGGYSQFTLRLEVMDATYTLISQSPVFVVTEYNSGGGPIEEKAPSSFENITPKEFSIDQNFPNPFNPETEVKFGVPEHSNVAITLTDIRGRNVTTLTNGVYSPGYHRVKWNGKDDSGNLMSSGIYFCRIIATGESGKQFSQVLKMTLTK